MVFNFVKFSPKFSYMIFKLTAQEIHGVCWRLLPKIETEICFKTSLPWIHNVNMIPLIYILRGGPQDLKIWNGSDKIYKIRMLEKKREHKANKTTKKLVLLKPRITVEATLWWKNMSFYKVRLVIYSLFLRYNTTGVYLGQYHG